LLLTALTLPIAAVPHISSYPVTLALLFFAMFVASGFGIGAQAYATRHYSTNHAGLITGLGSGSWSAVVALEMPLVGRLFDLRWYGAAFALATLIPVMGYALWRVLDRSSIRSADSQAGLALRWSAGWRMSLAKPRRVFTESPGSTFLGQP